MRKVPPPKPKRSPNTKLSGSYEEINAVAPHIHQLRPADVKLALLSRSGGFGGFGGLMQKAASIDAPQGLGLSLYKSHDEEDVYIEMMCSQQRARSLQEPPDSPVQTDSEAVYEEMKYFPTEDGVSSAAAVAKATKREGLGLGLVGLGTSPPQIGESKRTTAGVSAASDSTPSQNTLNSLKTPHGKDGSCDIPAPFPNLLPHRPPLLVFPPSPVTCSPASDESPLTPLEVKKLPVFETNLNYATAPDSPLSPQCARQRADSSPSLTVFIPDKKSTPPLTPPPPPPPAQPPPYRALSHFPFPPEASFLTLTRAASVIGSSDSPKALSSQRASGEPLGKPPPYSPVKTTRPEPRRAHSCSSSPLLFNPANGRALTSPLDELNTLFSSGRSLLRKSTSGRKMRDGGPSHARVYTHVPHSYTHNRHFTILVNPWLAFDVEYFKGQTFALLWFSPCSLCRWVIHVTCVCEHRLHMYSTCWDCVIIKVFSDLFWDVLGSPFIRAANSAVLQRVRWSGHHMRIT